MRTQTWAQVRARDQQTHDGVHIDDRHSRLSRLIPSPSLPGAPPRGVRGDAGARRPGARLRKRAPCCRADGLGRHGDDGRGHALHLHRGGLQLRRRGHRRQPGERDDRHPAGGGLADARRHGGRGGPGHCEGRHRRGPPQVHAGGERQWRRLCDVHLQGERRHRRERHRLHDDDQRDGDERPGDREREHRGPGRGTAGGGRDPGADAHDRRCGRGQHLLLPVDPGGRRHGDRHIGGD